jgi:hypothetical protein
MLSRLRPFVLLFLALTLVYHANLRPVDSSDSLPGSLIPFAVTLDHSLTLDRFVPWLRGHVWYTRYVLHKSHGHFFSAYPIGGPLLISPFYLPAAILVRGWDPESLVMFARIAEKFAAAAITAFSAVLVLVLLKRITSTGWSWCLTLVYALATETWSISSQALWQHGPAELAIIGTFLSLQLWSEDRTRQALLWICGGCTAAAVIFRPTSLVLLPAVLAAFLIAKAKPSEYLRLLGIPCLGGLLLVGYNYYVFQRLSGGYAVGLLNGSVVTGTMGLFLSPGRGLLIYTPVALFALFAFAPQASAARNRHKPILVAAAVFVVLDSLSISRSVFWWGGYCWGPRLLTELIPPLIVLTAIGVAAFDRPWLRSVFAALALYSVFVQGVGAFCYPKGHWDGMPEGVDAQHGRLWNWRDNPIARTIHGGLFWEPYSIVGAAFTGGLPAARLRMQELKINPFEETQPVEAKPRKVPRADRALP